jgi:hypothetical protein
MSKKQSSIDWLIERFYANEGMITTAQLEQAKAMHKEEHFNTWWHGISENEPITFEQYYNETFNP